MLIGTLRSTMRDVDHPINVLEDIKFGRPGVQFIFLGEFFIELTEMFHFVAMLHVVRFLWCALWPLPQLPLQKIGTLCQRTARLVGLM